MSETPTIKANRQNIREDQIVLGGAMIILFIIGVTFQTATTEAYGQHVQDTSVWNLFVSTVSQLPGIFTGSIHISELPRVLFGWVVEILYYACITGHQRMKQAVSNHHPWAIMALDGVAGACVLFCGYTDWQYAAQIIPGFWAQVFFSVLISAMVAYCGSAGVHFMKAGFGR